MTKVVELVGAKASGSLSWCRRVSSPFSPLTMIYQSEEGETFVDVDTYFHTERFANQLFRLGGEEGYDNATEWMVKKRYGGKNGKNTKNMDFNKQEKQIMIITGALSLSRC